MRTRQLDRGVTTGISCAFASVLLAASALAPTSTVAQSTGVITGTVTESSHGEPLATASVTIAALSISVLADREGRYILAGVPAGTHLVEAALIGYGAGSATVTVAAGETTIASFSLEISAITFEEIVVTGSTFAEPTISSPHAVAVSNRAALAAQGSPTVLDFFRRLGASHGTLGDQGSFFNGSAGLHPETLANVNLRGLGASRTLVLLNGRRHAYVPYRMAGGRFVDTNSIPAIALERIEVLKEGASAVYGSDAVAGVANFVTREGFEGIEFQASHEYFQASGSSNVGAIFGRELGGAHAIVSGEFVTQRELLPTDRAHLLQPFHPRGGGWSGIGNPGTFIAPKLTGEETLEEFSPKLLDAHVGSDPDFFVDPGCTPFGGLAQTLTCRYRYQPAAPVVNAARFLRLFGEVHGDLGDRTAYNLDVLTSWSTNPHWRTSPSFPPVGLYDGIQVTAPSHPGRIAFCRDQGASVGFASGDECLAGDWYYYGRIAGNGLLSRDLVRTNETHRASASLKREIEIFSEEGHLDLATTFARSRGDANLPAEYAYRKFLAFRGFGGPDCGVGVRADRSAIGGMAISNPGGAQPGQGACRYYNPFSNAWPNSIQPGAEYHGGSNPWFDPSLENSPELMDWINEEAFLDNVANHFIGDVTLTGGAPGDVVNYALGYQFRWLGVSATPNDPSNLAINPCPIPGDQTCAVRSGPFTFTNSFSPYEDQQTVHRFFTELPLNIGDRLDVQLAANYEFHRVASSFDPKLALRYRFAEGDGYNLSFRGSLQTTFRTPSVDDTNTDPVTTLQFVRQTGSYKAIDSFGSTDLVPEEALTFNLGAIVLAEEARVTVDYWSYDFRNLINVIPHAGITELYDQGGAARRAVSELVTCPDGKGTGTCEAEQIERVEIYLTNWPGMKTSGIDWHAHTHFDSLLPAGLAKHLPGMDLGLDGTWTLSYDTREFAYNGSRIQAPSEAVGQLNRYNPIAFPVPRLKTRVDLGFHGERMSFAAYANFTSSYSDESQEETSGYRDIRSHLTFDFSLSTKVGGFDVVLSAVNLADTPPPVVNQEMFYDPATHDARGRRVKLSLTRRMGSAG